MCIIVVSSSIPAERIESIMKPYLSFVFFPAGVIQREMARKVISQSTAHGKSHYHTISR